MQSRKKRYSVIKANKFMGSLKDRKNRISSLWRNKEVKVHNKCGRGVFIDRKDVWKFKVKSQWVRVLSSCNFSVQFSDISQLMPWEICHVLSGEELKEAGHLTNTDTYGYIQARKQIVMKLSPGYNTNAGTRPEILDNSPGNCWSLKGLRSLTQGVKSCLSDLSKCNRKINRNSQI